MAKINFGTIVNDARGKVNGSVFSKNKSGAYVRKKVTPANPNTPAQSLTRGIFATLSQAWSGTLGASDRAAWMAYAAAYPRNDIFGASIQLSGLNMFVGLNAVLGLLSIAAETNPPVSNVIVPIAIDPSSLVAVAGTSLVFQQTAPGGSGILNYIFAAKPLPGGRTPQKSDWRFLGTAAAGSTFPHPVSMFTLYTAMFGAWLAGQKICLLVASVDPTSGLTSVGTVLTAIST